MKLELFPAPFSICAFEGQSDLPPLAPMQFVAVTQEEVSLVCPTSLLAECNKPIHREDGFRAIYVKGELSFSLVGIIAKITDVLARERVSVFVVSTYKTDYVLVRETQLDEAVLALQKAKYSFS